jgi:hypothetical protein
MNERITRASPWTGFLTTLTVVAVAIAAYLWWNRAPPGATETISSPTVFRTPGGLLEVAAVNTTETFTKKSMLTVAGINLGTTVSQIQVPVTYRYQIEPAKDWPTYMRDGRFMVIVPAVRPSLPVAIDTSPMLMQTQAGWLRFNGNANLNSLLAEVSPELAIKARSPVQIEAQREQARKTVTEFVTKWLITQERWKAVKPSQVRVYFADEPIERLRTFGPDFGG